jgi:hypothetical protein
MITLIAAILTIVLAFWAYSVWPGPWQFYGAASFICGALLALAAGIYSVFFRKK